MKLWRYKKKYRKLNLFLLLAEYSYAMLLELRKPTFLNRWIMIYASFFGSKLIFFFLFWSELVCILSLDFALELGTAHIQSSTCMLQFFGYGHIYKPVTVCDWPRIVLQDCIKHQINKNQQNFQWINFRSSNFGHI